MGRKAFFTQEQVFEAADTLVAEGKEVSATALLNALGGGSLTTIYKHMADWQKARPVISVTPTLAEMPETVQIAFAAAWRSAAGEATKQVALIKEQANEEIKTAQSQFEEARTAIERLETEGEADAQKQEALAVKITELEKELQNAISNGAAYKATAEQLRHQVKSQEAVLERLHKDIDSERKQHQEEISKAGAILEKSNNQIDQLRQQLSQTQEALKKTEQNLSQSTLSNQEASKRADKSEQETAQARKEKEAAIKEAAELRGKAATLKSQNEELLLHLSNRKKSDK